MTVTVDTAISDPAIPNGVTTVFGFPFKIGSPTEVEVLRVVGNVETILSTGDYTVSIDPAVEGGTITFLVAPPTAGGELYIRSAPYFTQQTVISNQGFIPKSLNAIHDHFVTLALKLRDGIDQMTGRAILVARGETPPSISISALLGQVVGVNVSGQFTPAGDIGLLQTLLSAATPAALPAATVVTNIAALKALTKATLAPFVSAITTGASAAGDGGFGGWRWNASSTATDDGGSCVAANEGGTGRWIRARTTDEVWLEWWPVDKTGATDCSPAISAWVDYALANNCSMRVGNGLFLMATTVQKTVTATRVSMRGAGMNATEFIRAAGTVSADFQSMFSWQCTSGALISFDVSDLALNNNCLNNVVPGGNLPNNFTWQHCLCMEWHPLGASAIEMLNCRNIRIRFPISDGLSFRGGSATAPNCLTARFENIVNTDWDTFSQRPRVRGDITIAGFVLNLHVNNCVLPRFHVEPGFTVPAGYVCRIYAAHNVIGEYLGHMASVGPQTDTIKVKMRSSEINYSTIFGLCTTHFQDCTIRVGASAEGNVAFRQTPAITTMRNVTITVPSNYVGAAPTTGATNYLYQVDGGSVTMENCTVNIEAGATVLPEFFIDTSHRDTTGFFFRGLRMSGMGGMRFTLTGAPLVVSDVQSDWDGTTGGTYPGGWIMAVFGPISGYDTPVTIERVRFTNANGGGKLLTGGNGALASGANMAPFLIRDNDILPGNTFDFSSSGYGSVSVSRLNTPWNPSGSSPSWYFKILDQDEQGEASPTSGSYVRGQRVMKVGAAASASPGWVCVVTGTATSGNTATNFKALPALGA